MKVIKLIIIFVVILGGVVGALFLLTDGKKDVPISSSDTNMLPDTTVIGDAAVIEDATDKDNRITDPLDEADVRRPTQETRPKLKARVNPSESNQSKNEVSKKEKPNPSKHTTKTKHKYVCCQCGPNAWFKTKTELKNHICYVHNMER